MYNGQSIMTRQENSQAVKIGKTARPATKFKTKTKSTDTSKNGISFSHTQTTHSAVGGKLGPSKIHQQFTPIKDVIHGPGSTHQKNQQK